MLYHVDFLLGAAAGAAVTWLIMHFHIQRKLDAVYALFASRNEPK